MAHNLNRTNGKYSFVARGEKAWHGLGQYVNDPMTAAEVLKLSGLDYEVRQIPLFAKVDIDSDTSLDVAIDSRVANMRMDTHDVLGIVSPSYRILQNNEAFNFFDPIIDRGEAIYETAGALGKGERVFITAKLPSDIKIKGEQIDQYVLITNGHDGYNALIACLTTIRVVCNNTLTAALNDRSNSVTIYHQGNISGKLNQAHRVMGMASDYVAAITPIFQSMSETKMNDKAYYEFIKSVLTPARETVSKEEAAELSKRRENQIEQIMHFAKTHDTQLTDTTKNTVFGAYNSISGYLGWCKNYKSNSDRMKDISFGNGSKLIQKAFDLSLQLI